ncbi:MAG: DNA-binding protein [Schumannella sp.]|nr:DNA-binding protein [Schumannella sp.]
MVRKVAVGEGPLSRALRIDADDTAWTVATASESYEAFLAQWERRRLEVSEEIDGARSVVIVFGESLKRAHDQANAAQPPTALSALLEFSHATQVAGVNPTEVLQAVTATLARRSEGALLPENEAAFLKQFGDLTAGDTPESARRYSQLVAEQSARDAARFISTEEAADLLGIDASRVRHRRRAGDLIAHKTGRDLRFPLWQFMVTDAGNAPLPGLNRIAASTGSAIHPAELAGIMTTPQPRLSVAGVPRTPHDWLASGGAPEPVLELLEDDIEW